jgi:flagellar basal body-associated protein FliL
MSRQNVQNNQLPQMPSTKKMEINQTNNVQKYKSKGSGRKIVLIIVLSIVLLALIGVGIYLFLNLPE